jgi:PKD repeat protein
MLSLLMIMATVTMAQTPVVIYGTVTNLSSQPIAGKTVIIHVDSVFGPILPFSYSATVTTNSSGFYADTVMIPAGANSVMVVTSVFDCNNVAQYNFQLVNPPSPLLALNFSICDSATPPGCNAGFIPSTSPNSLTVSFADMSAPSPGSTITSWFWSFGDSTSSTQQNPTHTYTQPGTYNVCLTITDGLNCNSTSCITVVVIGGPAGGCNAGFIATPASGTTSVTFINTSSHQYIPAIYASSYVWNFGDGGTMTTLNYSPVNHSYLQPGTYTACVGIYVTDIVTNTVVCIDTFCTAVNVGGTPPATGFLYGTLMAGTGAAGSSKVYLIEHNALLGTLTAVDTTYSIDSSGVTGYFFPNIQPGNYLVKAAMLPSNPNYASNMPTYHQSSLFWSQATTVNVLPNGFVQADIQYIAGINSGGPGFIGGFISQGANKGPGDPIEGVLVMLLDVNNGDAPGAMAYSNATGYFSFSGIPYGTYKVYAEMLNKTTYPNIVTIDATTPSNNGVKIVVGSSMITGVDSRPGFPLSAVGSIHPNPVTDQCILPVSLKDQTVLNIEIVEMTGRKISSHRVELAAGSHTLSIDASTLPGGLYLVSVSAENGSTFTRKFVKK